MKKLTVTVFILLAGLAFAGCGQSDGEAPGDTTRHLSTDSDGISAPLPEPVPEEAAVLRNDSVDLNADGKPEKITLYQLEIQTSDGAAEHEGRIRIEGEKSSQDSMFVRRPAGAEGVFTSVEYADLDTDGTRDIFVLIPDSSASFNMHYFYIHSYSRSMSYMFNVDNDLGDFASGFRFQYAGGGRLEIKNDAFSFEALLDLTDSSNYSEEEAANRYYERAWVEPVPVEIGPDSKLGLVDPEGSAPLIKVPLPIFGQSTADIIGEIDLYYRVDKDFKPVMTRFEAYDFSGSEKKLVGEGIIGGN